MPFGLYLIHFIKFFKGNGNLVLESPKGKNPTWLKIPMEFKINLIIVYPCPRMYKALLKSRLWSVGRIYFLNGVRNYKIIDVK